METDPSLEFDHFLAQKLGMTAARLRVQMSNQEYVEWSVYFGRKAQREELELAKTNGR